MARSVEWFSVDVGDVELGVWHWPAEDGREGDPLVFLHATGFHARCWDAVIEVLSEERPVYAIDLRFHGTSGKEGDVEWPILAADIIAILDKLGLNNVFLIGHSIGGYLATIAAAERSDRVENLLLLDPVIMAPERYAFAEQMRQFMKPEDNPIARRRNAWSGPDEMYERFRERTPFSLWEDRVLRDYCAFALAPGKAPMNLACDPLHEVQIYMHQNGKAIQEALPKVMQPVTILRAVEPTEKDDPMDMSKSPTWPEVAAQFANATEHYHPELTHFIPMQAPGLVADHIKDLLD